jgi:hypothetical protein
VVYDATYVVFCAVIYSIEDGQYIVEQSFFTKRFKLAEQRWRAYPWGGVRVALRMFLQMQLSILYS